MVERTYLSRRVTGVSPLCAVAALSDKAGVLLDIDSKHFPLELTSLLYMETAVASVSLTRPWWFCA